MALEHFKERLSSLASTQGEIADMLDVDVRTVQRLLSEEVPLIIRALMRVPTLFPALEQDAIEGNIPGGTIREQRRFSRRKSPVQAAGSNEPATT